VHEASLAADGATALDRQIGVPLAGW